MKIKELILYTTDLNRQKDFYHNVLNFSMIEDNKDQCGFIIGKSVLSFRYSSIANPTHFAINIPSDSSKEALSWLKKSTSVFDLGGNEVHHFEGWKAKAIYFLDPDENIVEFISRQDVSTRYVKPFTELSVLNISEVGLATTNISKCFDQINKMKPIPVYSGDFNRFCAIGNPEGLFILANPNSKKWYPYQSDIAVADFIVKGSHNFKYKNGVIEEIT